MRLRAVSSGWSSKVIPNDKMDNSAQEEARRGVVHGTKVRKICVRIRNGQMGVYMFFLELITTTRADGPIPLPRGGMKLACRSVAR